MLVSILLHESNISALNNPTGTENDIVEGRMYEYNAYKCENRGAWVRGNQVNFYNSYFAGNLMNDWYI